MVKESFVKSRYVWLKSEYHTVPSGQTILIYVCQCDKCSNTIRVWSNSSNHSGLCSTCSDVKRRKQPYYYLYKTFLTSQKHRQMEVNLTFEEFARLCNTMECHYCGAPTIRDQHRWKKQSNAYMLDRKDNSLPYTLSNCVSCCWECNDLKSNKFSHDQFLKLRTFMKEELGI